MYRPLFKEGRTSSLECGEPVQILDQGKIWSEGIWVYKGLSDLMVRGRLQEAESEKYEVDLTFPSSLSSSLPVCFSQHTTSKLTVPCFSWAIHLGISKNGTPFP